MRSLCEDGHLYGDQSTLLLLKNGERVCCLREGCDAVGTAQHIPASYGGGVKVWRDKPIPIQGYRQPEPPSGWLYVFSLAIGMCVGALLAVAVLI